VSNIRQESSNLEDEYGSSSFDPTIAPQVFPNGAPIHVPSANAPTAPMVNSNPYPFISNFASTPIRPRENMYNAPEVEETLVQQDIAPVENFEPAFLKRNSFSALSLISSFSALIILVLIILTQQVNPLALLPILAGIVFGHIALVQIKKHGQSGKGSAIAGLIIGYICLLYVLVIIGLLLTAVVIITAN
jgi:Domain of unknown function (DUF4190)